jgi:competence protein ComEC
MPALTAWAVAALTLGAAPRIRTALGLLALLAAGALAWRARRLSALGADSGGPASGATRFAGATGSGRTAAAFVLAATALCLSASGMQGSLRASGRLPALADAGATVRLLGTVSSDPRAVTGSSSRHREVVLVRVRAERVEGRGLGSGARGRVLLFGERDWLRAMWGQRIEARGRLAPARPGDDVVATMDARGPPRLIRGAGPLSRAAERLRSGLRGACAGLSPDARGLLPGLVVGDTSAQPVDLGDDMKATGLTHLAAVSGTNITIVCGVALVLSRGAGLGRRLRLVTAGMVLVGFVVVARPEPSVLRAAVMGGLGMLALAGARRRAALPALSTAVVALLVADPWLARSYGFALSVLATVGILLRAGPWSHSLRQWLPHPLAVALAVPLAAQVACAPVLVLLSGQVSLVAVPANLLCEPLVAPATVLGLAAAMMSVPAPGLAAVLAHVAGWACTAIAETAHRLADVPGGQVAWPGGGFGAAALAAVTVAVAVAVPWLVRRRGGRAALVVVLAGGLALTATARIPLPGGAVWPPPAWVLVACDVGQGDALVLATGPGRAVLIDAGPDPDTVNRCLRRLHVRALDAIVLTHFHADHVDGLPGALRRRRAAEVIVTLVDDPPAQAQAVRRLAATAGLPLRTVRAGERGTVGGVGWLVLGPERVIRDGSVPNNASIVLLVRSHGLRLLLLGDVEPAAARVVARRLAAAPEGSRVDVLKVAHHGSALQDPALVTAARPRLALISVGAGNDYGHPASATLRLLAGVGATVGRTDLDGDLAVVADRTGIRLVKSDASRLSSP